MVYTKSRITFNDRIKPVCLPTMHYNEPDRYANEEVKFAGWGYYDTTHVASNDLRKATFKVLSKEECFSNALYARRKKYRDLWYCAGNEVSCKRKCILFRSIDIRAVAILKMFSIQPHPFTIAVGV